MIFRWNEVISHMYLYYLQIMERGLISFGDLLTYMSDKLVTKLSYFQLTQYIFAFGYYSRIWGPDVEYIQNFSMHYGASNEIKDF